MVTEMPWAFPEIMFNEKSKDRQSFKKWATHQGPRLAACPHTATEERV